MQCPICYAPISSENANFDVQLQIVERLKASGVKGIVFSGGEPLLNRNLTELIRFAKRRGLYTKLVTNGILLNDEILENLADCIDKLALPLDGPSPIVHSFCRASKHHFNVVMRLLSNLDKRPFKVDLQTVATSTNISYFNEMAILVGKLNIDRWCIHRYCPSSRNIEYSGDYEINDQDYLGLQRILWFSTKEWKDKSILIRDSDSETRRSYVMLSPNGHVMIPFGGEYRSVGNLFDIGDLSHSLRASGFNYVRHSSRYKTQDVNNRLKERGWNNRIDLHMSLERL